MKAEKFLKKVKEDILSIDKNARVILFGSRARGEARRESDWDILILTSFPVTEKNKKIFRYKLMDTEIETEQTISTLVYKKDHWKDYEITPLYRNIEMEGIEL